MVTLTIFCGCRTGLGTQKIKTRAQYLTVMDFLCFVGYRISSITLISYLLPNSSFILTEQPYSLYIWMLTKLPLGLHSLPTSMKDLTYKIKKHFCQLHILGTGSLRSNSMGTASQPSWKPTQYTVTVQQPVGTRVFLHQFTALHPFEIISSTLLS